MKDENCREGKSGSLVRADVSGFDGNRDTVGVDAGYGCYETADALAATDGVVAGAAGVCTDNHTKHRADVVALGGVGNSEVHGHRDSTREIVLEVATAGPIGDLCIVEGSVKTVGLHDQRPANQATKRTIVWQA